VSWGGACQDSAVSHMVKAGDAEMDGGVSEQLTEETLALFDILTKPHLDLSENEIKQVKKAARDLLEILRQGKLVLDWRKFQQSRAAVKVSIEDTLDEGLPESFTPELFQQKVEAVYQHVFDAYYGSGRGIYESMSTS
jgi:type I restriction enzyme R subunit